MPFVQLFYHLVWATKGRHAVINDAVEPLLYDFMRAKAIGLGGTVFAIGGMPDHVHLVVSVPPRMALAAFIGQVKGVSSAKLNKGRSAAAQRFAWQEEYGAFSFDAKRLPYVIAYVERQKEHHAQQSTIPLLERLEGDSTGYLARESTTAYLPDYDEWRAFMSRDV